MFLNILSTVLSLKGGIPNNISYKIIPTDHQSIAGSIKSDPLITSGEI